MAQWLYILEYHDRTGTEIVGHLWRALARWVGEKRVCLPTSDALLVLAKNDSRVGSEGPGEFILSCNDEASFDFN